MRHIIEFKLPKVLDDKLNELGEDRRAKREELKKKISEAVKVATPIVVGGTFIYLAGYNRGMNKSIDILKSINR